MSEFGVKKPWQAFVQIRLSYYTELLSDPATLRANQWPHNVKLLQAARRSSCQTGLATMSYCAQAQKVLQILDLADHFDFIAKRDDVENGKPDPEIYLLVAQELGVLPNKCLVLEDSPTGVQATLNAGMWCIAVTTPFTRDKLHASNILDARWIVDDPTTLPSLVEQVIVSHQTS